MITALIIGVIVVVAGAVAARARWSRSADERHSVQVHQHTIETLRHMADGREPPRQAGPGPGPGGAPRRAVPAAPRTRPVAAPARASAPPSSHPAANGRSHAEVDPARRGAERGRSHGPVHDGQANNGQANNGQAKNGQANNGAAKNGQANNGAARRAGAGGRRALVFVDEGAGPPRDVPPSGPAPATPRRPFPPPWAAVVRRVVATPPIVMGGAAVVVVVAIVLGVALSGGSPPARRGTARPPATRAHSHTSPPPAPVTTAVPAAVTPVAETADAASYRAPGSSYTVVLDATALCWVFATDSSTGQVVWTGTLSAGETRTLAATGAMTVRLGAASDVTASMDGTPVELPPGFQSPFTMTFQRA